jgi:hypothetical protein
VADAAVQDSLAEGKVLGKLLSLRDVLLARARTAVVGFQKGRECVAAVVDW